MTEQFDNWFDDHFKMLKMLEGDKNIALAAWTASRAAIVVDLLEQTKYDDPLSAYQAINDCADILRAAGITVKGEEQ